MKILNLVFHPNLDGSRNNKTWKSQLDESGKVSTSRDMYSEYNDFQIDVEREQALLEAHDRIILQFPFYWYSMPPLLKKWLDDVLIYNFAYGPEGDKLTGKDMQLVVSVGGREKFYSGFDIFTTVPDLLRPFQLTANLTQMNYLQPEYMFNADAESEEVIEAFGKQLVAKIDDPKRSDPRQYLYDSMSAELNEVYEDLGLA
ncbi:TPA: NAD(P)H-dependent oxidoreductase [Vibrio alginolyticus]|uniref:NAD(P)H-dependent oxidoreductase n=1 Tax=Vibrio alginolyticus TaxID=663 RepID=UPI00215C10F3|nr:NAD(P)H-dependent oxidoreductase [Vibrio alginolyticus]EGQ8984630.1 general stress protein [Vibrio alginolyticus]ELB2736560.1 NAD(P)H-dependent oxidoreductase [Vibrio alginolyticus]ELB2758675.1 NAD(P)H-dependent oxidoreductase [Vibrio alginolyticus]MCR9597471.1 NAD(P)H-dependent oxidoreductase [Vibrio alginolyticus]MCR9601979.1 NAD(P)H-dependent oxidoreductase [Vibrio alginolyticus]